LHVEDDLGEGIAVSSRFFTFLTLGLALIFIGVVIIVVASIALGGGSGSVGGVIFIGPIPIVFGSGPDSVWLILISLVITVISLTLFIVLIRRARRVKN